MKFITQTLLLLTVAALLSGFQGGPQGSWQDRVEEVGETTVSILAAGTDFDWILSLHRSEAYKLGEFVETYNTIAYKQGVPQAELCQELEQAAVVAIEQRAKAFYGLYDVECKTDRTGLAPSLQMHIWPKVSWGYRFLITFEQTH